MAKDSTAKRTEMLKSAFEIWGKTAFCNTSLKYIAKKFNITKQGLLKHFKKKEKFFEAMTNYFLEIYLKMLDDTIKIDFNNITTEKFIELYVTKIFNFFLDNIYFFFFFISPIFKKYYLQNNQIRESEKKQSEIFKIVLLKENISFNKNFDPIFIFQYIYIIIFFFIIKALNLKLDKKKFFIIPFEIEDHEKEEYIKKIKEIIINGFSYKDEVKIDFKKIEEECIVKDQDLPYRDKIFDAITKTVAKSNIWEASLSKIAKEAHINQSTLLYYFKNKKKMFNNLLIEEVERICNIFLSKINKNMSFEELLYSNMVVDYSYFKKDINSLYYFNWLHFQKLKGFNFQFMDEYKLKEYITKRYFFIIDAINNGVLKDYNLSFKDIITLLNMQVIIKFILDIDSKREISFINIRRIFLMFLYGIKKEIS